jgi:hypothetical protein
MRMHEGRKAAEADEGKAGRGWVMA